MDMQDKEFDSLFRSKLENFEAAPTGQVWDGIVEGLGGKRRYVVLLPWLSIAASVAVLVAAGILFIPNKSAVNPKHHIAAVKQPAAPTKQDTAEPQHREIIETPAPATVNHIAQTKPAKTKPVAVAKSVDPIAVPANAPQPQEQQIIAAVQPKEAITPEVPQTALITPQTIDVPVAAITKPTIAAVTLPVTDKQNTAPVRPKHKARGIGGFLNTVIAAVDKRKDKIIEFTESDDDDESNVTAVNLGILKFKQAK